MRRLHDRAREHELVEGADEREQRDDREHGQGQRKDDAPEDLRRGRPVDARRFVELLRDRVEEALQQPRVDAHGTAQVHEDQREEGIDTDEGEDRPDVEHEQVQRDDEQDRREHLDQEQGEHPEAPALETEAAEGVGGERPDQHGEEGRREPDEDRVQEPAEERRVDDAPTPGVLDLVVQQAAEVVEREVERDVGGTGDRLVAVERGGGDEPDGE